LARGEPNLCSGAPLYLHNHAASSVNATRRIILDEISNRRGDDADNKSDAY